MRPLTRTLVAIATVLTTTGILIPFTTTSAAAAITEWSGFRIADTGKASGGWIGGYRIARKKAYVVTPNREPVARTTRYRAERTADFRGRRGPTTRATARAAWILSKYGGYRYDVQQAAVDAAVQHLLTSDGYRIDGAIGRRRIRQSGDPAKVREFARIMLEQSAAHAGRYRVRLRVAGVDVNNHATAAARVVDGRGRPVPGVMVRFRFPGNDPVTAVTGRKGRARVTFLASRAGWQTARAAVRGLPQHRLILRVPRSDGRPIMARAGVRRTVVDRERVPVRGTQDVVLRAKDPVVTVGQQRAGVRFELDGWGGDRTATATAYGPFATASAATCSGDPRRTTTLAVGRDGTYATPSRALPRAGYFAWRLEVAGNRVNQRAVACGAVTTVRAAPVAAVENVRGPVNLGKTVQAKVTARRYPADYPVTAVVRLYGPFPSRDKAGCRDGALHRHRTVTVRAGERALSPAVVPRRRGLYLWQVVLRPTELTASATSACRASGTFVRVQ